MQNLSLPQTVSQVECLISNGGGDIGRLYHILESLKNNRTLYHSDKMYLEKKLDSSFSVEEEPVQENALLPKIKDLIDSGTGDLGRLQHIYDVLLNNRTLYASDSKYLESKLKTIPQESKILNEETTQVYEKTISKSNDVTVITPYTPAKIKGTMPKGWSANVDLQEIDTITENIKNEQQKIEKQQKINDEILLQRENLSQLITRRQKYEEKINQERLSLESHISEERTRIQTQTKLSNEIVLQKQELVKIKKEKLAIAKKIESEKIKISRELLLQKKQLVQAQLEQENIEKQIQNEQELLAKMANDQKNRLSIQAQIAHEIASKQSELEKTKKDYEYVVSQVKEEKAKFAESEKLKRLLKIQEQDLIKTKEERLRIVDIIAKEKELIVKKTEEEKAKLMSQSELAKQLKKEVKMYDSLKRKREKLEIQIKTKNQKLKEKQQMLKNQIQKKDKELKLVLKTAKKPAKKPTTQKAK